jgi:prepilin-type processing-associated H-X9-DG protein
MIMLADSRAWSVVSQGGIGAWEANLDPTDTPNSAQGAGGGQEPSNRHNYKTDVVFCDGHCERVQRNDKGLGNAQPKNLIDSTKDNPWRNHWCIDNQPHNECFWPTVASTLASGTACLYNLDTSF